MDSIRNIKRNENDGRMLDQDKNTRRMIATIEDTTPKITDFRIYNPAAIFFCTLIDPLEENSFSCHTFKRVVMI